MFENSPLKRRFWSGLDDDHLASIGFANFAWNVLERKFASLIWVTANWTQEIGELVTADLGNVSAKTLFLNLLRLNLRGDPDDRILEQGLETGAVFDGLRADRNDMVHSFFFHDPTQKIGRHIKLSAKKPTGEPEIKTVALAKSDIDAFCEGISACFDSIDDLIHKIHFRRKFLEGERGPFARTYEQAVHGWRAPSFDTERLRAHLKLRAQRGSSRPNSPPPLSPLG